MSVIKITASADTTIVNSYGVDGITRAIYANMGAADSLEMYSISGGYATSSIERSRILVSFPYSKVSELRSAGSIPASGSAKFYLNLYNVEHPLTLPSKYYAIVRPISQSWEEGNGLDLDEYRDLGWNGTSSYGTNWVYRSSGSAWATTGGTYLAGYDKEYYFDVGTEDLSVDVTDVVEAHLNGTSSYGFGIMISGAYEDGTYGKDFFTKRFSARSSEYFYSRPSLEVRFDSGVRDDRNKFYVSASYLTSENSQSVYYKHVINGKYSNLPSLPLVALKNSSSSTQYGSTVTASLVSAGIYKATFVVNANSTLTSSMYANWSFSSSTLKQDEVKLYNRTAESFNEEYYFNITNIKAKYSTSEKAFFRVYSREKDWSPTVYTKAKTSISTTTHKNLYYKVFRVVDKKTIIDYGITPVAYTLVSYDESGNYIDLDMSYFEAGYSYAIQLMLLNGDEKKEYLETFKFRVE